MTAAVLTALRTLAGSVFRMSLAGGVAVLLCLPACWALRRLHIPRITSYALWLVVLMRLLCPLGLPVSVPARAAAGTFPSGLAAGPDGLSLVLAGELPAPQAALLPADVLALVWLVVACLLLARAVWHTARLRRSVRTAWREEAGGIVYYTGTCVASPFLLGWLHPRIYLPTGLTDTERRHILLHERAHLRHGDHWLRPLYYLAACIHWFNPLAWLAFDCARRESEALCDEAVLRTLGDQAKTDYCQSLLRFAVSHCRCKTAVAFGEGSVKIRIEEILHYRRSTFWSAVCGTVIALAVGMACLASPVRAETPVQAAPTAPSSATNGLHHEEAHHGTSHHPEPHPAGNSAVSSTETLLWPVPDYAYVSRWCHEVSGTTPKHQGADIAADAGTDILAAASGTVTHAAYDSDYGWMVIIDHGNDTSTVYAHCLELCVEEGQTVTQGQKIATVGSTGKSTGNHCHFEVRQGGEWLQVQDLFESYAGQ